MTKKEHKLGQTTLCDMYEQSRRDERRERASADRRRYGDAFLCLYEDLPVVDLIQIDLGNPKNGLQL